MHFFPLGGSTVDYDIWLNYTWVDLNYCSVIFVLMCGGIRFTSISYNFYPRMNLKDENEKIENDQHHRKHKSFRRDMKRKTTTKHKRQHSRIGQSKQ